MVQRDEAVRQLDHDDDAVGPRHLTRPGQHIEALRDGQVLDHRVEQDHVDGAGVAAQPVADLLRRVGVEVGVLALVLGRAVAM